MRVPITFVVAVCVLGGSAASAAAAARVPPHVEQLKDFFDAFSSWLDDHLLKMGDSSKLHDDWLYILRLGFALFHEGLLDREKWLEWLLNKLDPSQIMQAWYFVPLLVEHLDGFLACRKLARRLVDMAHDMMARPPQVRNQQALCDALRHIVCMLLLRAPDVFVPPLKSDLAWLATTEYEPILVAVEARSRQLDTLSTAVKSPSLAKSLLQVVMALDSDSAASLKLTAELRRNDHVLACICDWALQPPVAHRP